MRRFAFMFLLALAACGKEESFEQRYDTAQGKIDAKAEEIDAGLAASEEAEEDGQEGAD